MLKTAGKDENWGSRDVNNSEHELVKWIIIDYQITYMYRFRDLNPLKKFHFQIAHFVQYSTTLWDSEKKKQILKNLKGKFYLWYLAVLSQIYAISICFHPVIG